MNTKSLSHHNLNAFPLADGTIRLTQQAGIDDPAVIDLHTAQLECLAKTFGIGREKELERRLAVLADKIQDVVGDAYLRGEILKRCGSGLEIIARLDAVLDLAMEFDGGRLAVEEVAPAPEETPPPAEPSRFAPLPPPKGMRQSAANGDGQLDLV